MQLIKKVSLPLSKVTVLRARLLKLPLSWLLWLWSCLLAVWIILLVFTMLPLSKAIADDDTALGYSSGLNGEVENGTTTLPQGSTPAIPNGVRPVIVLPPESLQPRTLVVPLPNEQTPPVILRRNSIEVLPSITPALPRSRINNGQTALPALEPSAQSGSPAEADVSTPPVQSKRGKSKKSKTGQADSHPGNVAPAGDVYPDDQHDQGRGSTIKTKPLDPILD